MSTVIWQSADGHFVATVRDDLFGASQAYVDLSSHGTAQRVLNRTETLDLAAALGRWGEDSSPLFRGGNDRRSGQHAAAPLSMLIAQAEDILDAPRPPGPENPLERATALALLALVKVLCGDPVE